MNGYNNGDDFFESFFGYRPKKRGKGYELLVGAVLKLIGLGEDVRSSESLRGIYSDTVYPIDILIKDGCETIVEAKDYTKKMRGREDLQKLSGALQDLSANDGIVASLTGFTEPAKKYSEASKYSPNMKPIYLAHIRPSKEEDEKGRIKTIIIEIILKFPVFYEAKYEIKFADEKEIEKLKPRAIGGNVTISYDAFYDKDGNIKQTVKDFTLEIQHNADTSSKLLKGKRIFDDEPTYIKVDRDLLWISSIEYEVPYKEIKEEIRIEAAGKSKVFVKFEDGTVNTLITDEQLKLIQFTDDGKIIIIGDPIKAKAKKYRGPQSMF